MASPSRFYLLYHRASGRYNDTLYPLTYQPLTEFQNNLLYAAGCERGEKMHYFHDM